VKYTYFATHRHVWVHKHCSWQLLTNHYPVVAALDAADYAADRLNLDEYRNGGALANGRDFNLDRVLTHGNAWRQ
jgi:hypothetical protein